MPHWQLNEFLLKSLELIQLFSKVTFNHIYREGNSRANQLANLDADVKNIINLHPQLVQHKEKMHNAQKLRTNMIIAINAYDIFLCKHIFKLISYIILGWQESMKKGREGYHKTEKVFLLLCGIWIYKTYRPMDLYIMQKSQVSIYRNIDLYIVNYTVKMISILVT